MNDPDTATTLLTSRDVADLTGYSCNTINYWMATGKLVPAFIVGRRTRLIRREDALACAEKMSKRPNGGPRPEQLEEVSV